MRVLGVDPGLGRTGVAIVEGQPSSLALVHARCLTTVPHTSDALRLSALLRMMSDVVAEFQPDIAAVEQLFFSTNRRTAMQVSQARGVTLCALAGSGVDVVEYGPNEIKEAVAGYGSARKPQVTRMVLHLLRLPGVPGPDDVADACAVAICHHHRARLGARRTAGQRGNDSSAHLDAAIGAAQSRLARARP